MAYYRFTPYLGLLTGFYLDFYFYFLLLNFLLGSLIYFVLTSPVLYLDPEFFMCLYLLALGKMGEFGLIKA